MVQGCCLSFLPHKQCQKLKFLTNTNLGICDYGLYWEHYHNIDVRFGCVTLWNCESSSPSLCVCACIYIYIYMYKCMYVSMVGACIMYVPVPSCQIHIVLK